jgi:transmembrane sensor
MDDSNQELALGKAAQYCARLAAADCTVHDRNACDQWRAADPMNDLAFQQVASVSGCIDRAVKSDARLQDLVARAYAAGATIHNEEHDSDDTDFDLPPARSDPNVFANVFEDPRRNAQRSKYRMPVALAAGLLLATVAVWMATVGRSVDPAFSRAQTQLFSAPEKSPLQVTLGDGSIVHIDAGAKLSVSLGAHERRITVLAGRVFFEVAHDAQRPFVVTANDTQTVALGTQFEVQRRDTQTTVTLIEGSVAVSGTGNKRDWSERLEAGNQLRILTGTAERARSEVDIESATSWSRGWLVFHGTHLDEAVRQINRYSTKQVVLAEGSLADLTIAGSFIAGESESIVNALAEVLPIRVVDGGSREIILFKRYEN